MNIDIVCEDSKYIPEYANASDACMDIKIKIEHKSGSFILQPNGCKVFRTGLKVKVPDDHVMLIFPRSSLGIKKKCRLMNDVGVIDSGYRDEIKLAIHNFGDYSVEFTDGERLAQFMIIPRPKLNLNLVADDNNFKIGDRGGGIGSTNAKQ